MVLTHGGDAPGRTVQEDTVNTTAIQNLTPGTTYVSQGLTWKVLEQEKLNTGNYRILGEVITAGEHQGHTFTWYGTEEHSVEATVTKAITLPGETYQQFSARQWGQEHPAESALVNAWYAGPAGRALKARDKDQKDGLGEALAAQDLEALNVNRGWVAAARITSATTLLEGMEPITGRDTHYTGFYAVESAAACEDAAERAMAAYLAAADAPAGEVRDALAHTAEYARREAKDQLWQTEGRAKGARTGTAARALVAARVAVAQLMEVATAWDQLTGKRFTCNDLEMESQWREAAVALARMEDAAMEAARTASYREGKLQEDLAKDTWNAQLDLARTLEAKAARAS